MGKILRRVGMAALVAALIYPSEARAAFKTIDGPDGGQITYGQADGQNTEAGAMATVLRTLHDKFGQRPKVGKLFDLRGTKTVAAFFSVDKQSGGANQLAGLIIAAKLASDRVEIGMITDDGARFGSNYNSLMKSLFAAWHPFNSSPGAAAGPGVASTSEGAAPVLKPAFSADRAASVNMPEDWKVVPGLSGGGTLTVVGPNGEIESLNLGLYALDPNNPHAAAARRQAAQRGMSEDSAQFPALYSPGGDLMTSYTDIVQIYRRKHGLEPAMFELKNLGPLQAQARNRGARLQGHADYKDGKGQRDLTVLVFEGPENPNTGRWMMQAYAISAPVAVAEKENATIVAVFKSFHTDLKVIHEEGAKLAAPEIARIHAIGDAAAASAKAQHERNDIQNETFHQTWDSEDRQSKSFSDYQLGYSVVHDNAAGTHKTYWNADAQALVEGDPQRYEYVNSPNYWKGVDY